MKPDVLVQIKEIEAKRAKMIEEEMAKQKANGPIILQQPGKEPIQLSQQDVVNIIQQQQQQIAQLTPRVTELEKMITMLQRQLIEKTKNLQKANKELNALKQGDASNVFININSSKSEPEVVVDVNAP
jgi:TolA-binding protein